MRLLARAVLRSLIASAAVPPPDGVPGERDPEAPCSEFQSGDRDVDADCETDGHYLCADCRRDSRR